MRRSKKLIIAAVLAGVLLFGSLGGIALADDGDDGPAAKFGEFIDKVIANYEGEGYTLESPEALKQAFADTRTEMAEARAEMRAAAMESRLAKLVEEGKITEEEADELQGWWQSRPDVPVKFGLRGHSGFRGMGGVRGFGGPCAPAE